MEQCLLGIIRGNITSLLRPRLSQKTGAKNSVSPLEVSGDGGANSMIRLVAGTIAVTTMVAAILWFAHFLTNQESPFPFGNLFALTQVAAIFCGLGLVAGFSSNVHPSLGREMRRVSILYLLSALGFSLAGMLLPASASSINNEPRQLFEFITATSFLVAAISFGIGTFLWTSCIPRLIRNH